MSASKGRTRPPCGKKNCNVKIKPDDKHLKCENCKSLFHINCSNFDEEVYDSLIKSSMLNEIIWCCTICRPKVKKIIGIIDAIDDKLNEVDNIINEFKTTVNTRLEKLENNLEDKKQ